MVFHLGLTGRETLDKVGTLTALHWLKILERSYEDDFFTHDTEFLHQDKFEKFWAAKYFIRTLLRARPKLLAVPGKTAFLH